MTSETDYHIRLPDDLKQGLKDKAIEEDRTLSQVIRRALRVYVSDYKDNDWIDEALRADRERASTKTALAKRKVAK